MQRHSTSDDRRPESRIRHSSLFTRHFPLCVALAALVAANASAADVARFVEYIESDGSAGTPGEYILLDYTPASNSVVEADVAILDKAKTHTVFCSRSGGSSRTFTCFYVGNEGFRWDYNVTQNKSGKKISTDGERHTVRCSKTGFEYDGTLAKAITPADFTPGNKMALFASYNNQTAPTQPTPNDNFAKMKLYSFKAWNDDGATLKVDLYPCVDTDGTAALYDCVTRRLYYNLKSGTSFTASPTTVPPPPSFLKLDVAVAQTNDVWYATVAFENGSGAVDLLVVSQQGATNVVALSNGVATAPAAFTVAIPGLTANTFYSVAGRLTNNGLASVAEGPTFLNSPVSVEVTANATSTNAGVFTVSRPAAAGATNMPLTVAFTLSGTAVAGTHYLPIPETVTIPAGVASATIEVATLAQATAATSLTLSLSCDNCLPGNPASATMAVDSVFFTGDWFVAKDGDDRNSGASRAEAKATISAAYACLTNIPAARVGNRLVICDGEWTISEPIILSNAWSVTSEHGRAYTTVKPGSITNLFELASADSTISGLTVDLNFSYSSALIAALLAPNPVGTIDDCTVRNLKPAYATSSVRLVRISSGAAEVFIRNCSFENCSVSYRSALFWIEGGGKIHFDGCSFTECHGRNPSPSGNQYYNYGMIFIASSGCTLRNCLFKRCTVYGNYSDTFNQSSVVCISKNCNAVVENCTFVSCSALGPSKGGALACATVLNESHMAGTAKNCLAVNCKNAFGPAGLMHGFTYSHCAQETALDGEGNVVVNDSNTTWQNPLNDSYFPESGPAVDGGETLDWMATATDLRGNARVIGSAPDIGCHEYPGYPRNTYYVAKDGDDANSGLTRAEAKATLADGYALLHGEDETLVICDGIWDYAPDGSLVLSNGWTLTSEHGADATTLKATQSGYLFKQPEGRTLVEGITFNLANVAFGTDAVSGPQGVISGCVFSNSYHSTAWASARMMLLSGGTPLVTNCLFRDCRAKYNGVSVIWASGGSAKIVDCSFVDCYSGTSGTALGAVYCYAGSTTMRNCLFLRCKSRGCTQGTYAPNGGHIVAVGRTGTLFADNCSFIDCTITGSEKAGALGTTSVDNRVATLVATNCFAYGNVNALGPANLMTNTFPTCSATFSHCASDYLLPGDGNVVLTDTNFNCARAGRGDHTPTRGPTLDAGVLLPWMTGAKDILGRDRVVGAAPDIGCFEYDNRAATRLLLR